MKQYWDRMRELREDHDLTQKQLAEVLKTTQQVYSRYEIGQTEMPIRHLITLCEFYHVSADYMLNIQPEKDGKKRIVKTVI